MARKLAQRERRMVIFGALAAVAIVGLHYGLKGRDRWEKVRASLKSSREQLASLTADPSKQAALRTIVPVAEMPQVEETQQFLIRDRLHEQLKKAGIKTEPLTILPLRKKPGLPYDAIRIRCTGKCQLTQLLDFLATVYENPYLVGIEELRIRCDTKEPPEKRKDVEIDLVVSSFVRRPELRPAQLGGR
ncbi:MAG: hypothetical protein RBR19_06840 [Sedimentisphaerales bacterium]|jgi:hypothetical protein|nr:hypothetical protein [Planctomycetota bacterium]MDY0355577.1 hypothetical protein [Sedimentisphaerales bacterium]NLT78241.1 hypothetical protein [Planctomycetota bacterium]